MKKLYLGLIVSSGTIVAGLASAVLFNGFAHGEWDLPGLNQQVQHVTEVTTNHEGRITNLENKVDTPPDQPAPTPQVITKVVTQVAPTTQPAVAGTAVVAPVAATPTPVPTPFMNTVELICNANHQEAQKITWSDGRVEERVIVKEGNSHPCGLDGSSSSTIRLGL